MHRDENLVPQHVQWSEQSTNREYIVFLEDKSKSNCNNNNLCCSNLLWRRIRLWEFAVHFQYKKINGKNACTYILHSIKSEEMLSTRFQWWFRFETFEPINWSNIPFELDSYWLLVWFQKHRGHNSRSMKSLRLNGFTMIYFSRFASKYIVTISLTILIVNMQVLFQTVLS